MPKIEKEFKLILCEFREDGTVHTTMIGEKNNEPFMKDVGISMDKLADKWFFHVMACQDAKVKVEGFDIIIKK